jgi:RHS repeat-associated protein
VIRASAILTALLCGFVGVPAFAQCVVPQGGGQSVGWALTDYVTGLPLANGTVVPASGGAIKFHEYGTAAGVCLAYAPPDCSQLAATANRLVNHFETIVLANSSALNGTYVVGYVYGMNPSTGMGEEVPSLDDSAADSTGPMADFVTFVPGTFTFTLYNIIDATFCPIPPNYVSTSMTVSYDSAGGDKNLGACTNSNNGNDGQSKVGDPCDADTGNNYQREADYASWTLPLVRHYNSLLGLNVGLGYGWTTAYHRRLEPFGNTLRVRRADGESEPFTLTNGVWQGDPDSALTVTQDATGFTVIVENGDTERYNLSGQIQYVQGLHGTTWTWAYDSQTNLLSSVTDSFGNALTFQYGTNGLLSTVVLPDGSQIQYAYDANSNLTGVTYPDSTTRTYVYGNAFAGAMNQLTGIIDESSALFASYSYSTNYYTWGTVISNQHAGGADAVSLNYLSLGSTAVTDAFGVARTYTYETVVNRRKTTAISGTACLQCGGANAVVYDSQGNATSRTDFNGVQTIYSYDLTRNLETSRTEAYGTSQARTITTQWNASFRLPSLITEPNRTTAYSYDTSGDLLTKTMTDTAASTTRTWTDTYDSYGRVLTAKGPRTDLNSTTTYTYYTCTSGYQCGQLQTVTDAIGNVTTYNTYNAHGQPLTITDPNGVVTTLTYDARQRLTSRAVSGETTSFSYWPTGFLKQVTLPDGSYLLYSYDGAHRLTQISDGLGDKIVYTLDAMGNRTAENTYDPSNTLHRTHTRVYNVLDELYQDVNAAGTSAVTTTYAYDYNGNQTSIAAPLSRNTANGYDALNRITQITDPGSGHTYFGYDANDNRTSVQDPRSLTTNYTYTGFGDLKTQASPDTGTTTDTYDSGGNLATSTDSRGAVSTYAYDALNRVTSVAYSSSGTTDQTISFTYDSGTNGKGRLTGASDANHSMAWSYDASGRVTGKGQTVASTTLAVGYGYSSGDLMALTTPSGQTVSYGYNSNHQITSITVNGTTVLNAVSYEPLGPVNGWAWGNSTTVSRSYNTDGKITAISSAGTKSLTYDNAFRITGISDTSTGSDSWSYGYDLLDRITSGADSTITRGWTYDANGNRLTETGSAASSYTISSSSNQVTSTTGTLARTYSYDAAGNTLSYSSATATYNNRGRLSTLINSSAYGTETLLYNALGQMMKTSGGAAGTVLYAYDEAGHVLGEYTSSGGLIEETVWLGDIPVATLQPSGSTIAIYYLHTDELNAPRQVTRPSDNAQMWTWFSDPFGTELANGNPAGVGTFTYNLRFPGQIFDGQVGLHQNYFRDYDPAVGRYVESDPIGLKGGNNTYSYVLDNPVNYIDTTGLDVQFCCRGVDFPLSIAGFGLHHCYFRVNGTTYGLYPQTVYDVGTLGIPSPGNPKDTGGKCKSCKAKQCTDPAKCVMDSSAAYPVGAYGYLDQNSNTYAGSIARKCCDGGVPTGLGYAPGIDDSPPLGFHP